MEIKVEHILAFIAIAWPASWAWWIWYWREGRIKLNVIGYRIRYKKNSKKIIGGLDLEIYLFNYGDRPIGVAEGVIITNLHKMFFVKIYLDEKPVTIMPNQSEVLENNISNAGEFIKEIKFALADGRTYRVDKRVRSRLNFHIKNIGTKNDELMYKKIIDLPR